MHGSHAYGLAREGSDTDVKGVIVGPARWYHGFVSSPEQLDVSKDHVRYEIRKFFRLAAACNPTLIEVLWTDRRFHRTVTPAGQRLLDHRRSFLSRRIEGTFGRYAEAQLKRMQTHRRWAEDPPDGPDHPDWKKHQTWLRTRNPMRAELERRFGYDTKHALHLVRLLRMAVEMTRTGEVHVLRPDREELLAIRDGAWTYETLVGRAESLLAQVEAAAPTSPLPERVDMEALNALCASLVEEVLATR